MAVCGNAAAWGAGATAQTAERVPQIGLLMTNEESDPQGQERLAALRRALQDLGWAEGRNLRIHVRWSGGDVGRIRIYTSELVGMEPDLIIANGSPVVAAMKRATTSIPIVFVVVNDPVAQGIVPSVARPGGNITGFSFLDYTSVEKSLDLFRQVAPAVERVAVIFNPDTYPYYDVFMRSFSEKALRQAIAATSATVRSEDEIERTVGALGGVSANGLLVPPDPFTIVHRRSIIQAAEARRVPAIYFFRQFVREGALMSYGADTSEIFRRSAGYVDRILKGTKAADLPVQAPTKYELAINVRAAKAAGLDVPPALLALADEVVE
jgi:putative ABC transport system substrate-binding protein